MVGTVPSYIALGGFLWRRRRIQNQVMRAAIAPTTTTPPTTHPTIRPVLGFEDEVERFEVWVGEDVPTTPPYVRTRESVVDVTPGVDNCCLVAVASGRSTDN